VVVPAPCNSPPTKLHKPLTVATAAGTALPLKANSFSVCFYRLEDLLYVLKKQAEIPTERLKHKKYMAANLLVVDEMGFQALSREEANLFFRLVSYRYQRGAVCITTNKSIKAWPETFAGDEVLTTANSHIFRVVFPFHRIKKFDSILPDTN
jgi:DNA replication protein DnaC